MTNRVAPLAHSVRDVAAMLGRSEAAIRAMIARSQLPARRQGRRVFILDEDLKAYVNALTRRPLTGDKS